MKTIGQALQEALTLNTSDSLSDSQESAEHICPYCSQVVPPLEINILGIVRRVQPRCRCEVQAYEAGIQEAAERKRRNDIERKFAISSLGARFQECRFETFSPRFGSDRLAETLRRYAESFDGGPNSYVIWGVPGNGKTHLAAAVCHTIKERGFIPVFQSVPELLERIRNTFDGKHKETEREIMAALLECDLLVLDDIGAEKPTEWVQDVLFRIVDGRYRNKRPILYTSNFDIRGLAERLGPRIVDRMVETSTIIENKATSYRMESALRRDEG